METFILIVLIAIVLLFLCLVIGKNTLKSIGKLVLMLVIVIVLIALYFYLK